MKLVLHSEAYSICRLPPASAIPGWARQGAFHSVTRTSDELSIVCEAALVPAEVKQESGWRVLKTEGPLDFGLTGILASILAPLAGAKVSVFAVSTFDTDYVLVRVAQVSVAVDALRAAGHQVTG